MTVLFRPLAILAAMRSISGWLTDAEAELLMAGAAYVACGGAPRTLVEIGSYQGRSTVVLGSTLRALSPQSRLFALDPHEGTVGAADAQLYHGASTEERFLANILAAGLTEQIHPVRARSYEVSWPEVGQDRSIDLLFVDGLHDRLNVERDFRGFEAFLAREAIVLFHDYGDYYPGVRDFVDALVGREGWRVKGAADSMRLLTRPAGEAGPV